MFSSFPMKSRENIEFCILSGLFLCTTQDSRLLNQLAPQWHEEIHLSPDEKCKIVEKESGLSQITPGQIFPWNAALSEGMDHPLFCLSFLIWPSLYIRIRPGYEKTVKTKLDHAGLFYQTVNNHCLAFDNAVKLDTVLEPDKEIVVQDYNSQQIKEFLHPLRSKEKLRVWDCCSGSGGKSILALDVLKDIDITVTDIRKTILVNLKKRFAAAGIGAYTAAQMDLTGNLNPTQSSLYDLIIADVPCSGSGTWSRTPEQLYFWQEERLNDYVNLQNKITDRIIPFLKPDGYMLYITCSVFKAENEDRVRTMEQRHGLKLIKMDVLKGYDKKADTLFAALLRKTQK